MKKTGIMYLAVILVILIAAVGVYFLLNTPRQVTYDGQVYKLTSIEEDFVSLKFEFEAEDGSWVKGSTCADCGGVIVTHSTAGMNITGKAVRSGFSYKEESVSTSCAHTLSPEFSHDDAYLFTQAVYSQRTINKNSMTVWVYVGIGALVSVCGVYFSTHESKKRKSWLGTVMIGGGGVLALAVIFDLLMM